MISVLPNRETVILETYIFHLILVGEGFGCIYFVEIFKMQELPLVDVLEAQNLMVVCYTFPNYDFGTPGP